MMSPCKDCPERSIGCHDHCLAYANFKRNVKGFREYESLNGMHTSTVNMHTRNKHKEKQEEKKNENW